MHITKSARQLAHRFYSNHMTFYDYKFFYCVLRSNCLLSERALCALCALCACALIVKCYNVTRTRTMLLLLRLMLLVLIIKVNFFQQCWLSHVISNTCCLFHHAMSFPSHHTFLNKIYKNNSVTLIIFCSFENYAAMAAIHFWDWKTHVCVMKELN